MGDDDITRPETPTAKRRRIVTLEARLATPGEWIDTNQGCSAAVLSALRAEGKVGVGRYVPLPRNRSAGDIGAEELARICDLVGQCLLFQHVRSPEPGFTGWRPSHHSGVEDAEAAVDHALMVGYPQGSHIVLDFENIDDTPQAATKFAIDWQATVRAAGWRAMLYVGFQVPLHALDLYDLPGFDCYASDLGDRRVATRGTSYLQTRYNVVIAGVGFDTATMRADALGSLPYVASLAAAA